MSIAEQFSGLDMKNLIGGPLSAAADASELLARSTADFINDVGFDADGKVRTAAFGYQRRTANDDGSSNLESMQVNVPILAIVPIPNLQVDEVNILFDMEVKQTEKSESTTDWNGSLTGSIGLGILKVSITGSVSSHSSNTRSTDNSAKYHVDVRATNHGTPEGLARVLDMMASCVSPTLVSSELKDGDGQDLNEEDLNRAKTLKTLRSETASIERKVSAARNNLDNRISMLKKIASNQQSIYQATITQAITNLNPDSADYQDVLNNYSGVMDQLNQVWNNFQSQAPSLVKLISDSSSETEGEVSTLFGLKSLSWNDTDKRFSIADYAKTDAQYDALASAQSAAVSGQKDYDTLEDALMDKKAEYNDVMMGLPADSPAPAPAQKTRAIPAGSAPAGEAARQNPSQQSAQPTDDN